MKKLFVIASLMMIISISAQETSVKKERVKPTTEHKMKAFEDLNLTSAQEAKLEALFAEKQANMEAKKELRSERSAVDKASATEAKKSAKKDFDSEIQNILTEEQYARYKAKKEENKALHGKDGKRSATVK